MGVAVEDVSKTEGIGGSGAHSVAGDFAEFCQGCNRLAVTVQRAATRFGGAMLGSGQRLPGAQRAPVTEDEACREELRWNLCGAWSHSLARPSRRSLAMSSITTGSSRSSPA